MELKESIQAAFDAASQTYENGHLKGDQIKDHLTKAMSLVDTDAAMLMQGTKVTNKAFKIKAFPTERFKKLEEPAFQNVSDNAPVAETDVLGEGEDGSEGDEKPFDIEAFIAMSPKDAVEKYGIETIDQMIKNLAIEVADDAKPNQKAAALKTFLSKNK